VVLAARASTHSIITDHVYQALLQCTDALHIYDSTTQSYAHFVVLPPRVSTHSTITVLIPLALLQSNPLGISTSQYNAHNIVLPARASTHSTKTVHAYHALLQVTYAPHIVLYEESAMLDYIRSIHYTVLDCRLYRWCSVCNVGRSSSLTRSARTECSVRLYTIPRQRSAGLYTGHTDCAVCV